jgi:hypothetical protein
MLGQKHADHERLPGVFVDDVERSIDPPVSGAILDEVIGPNVVGPLRPKTHAGAIVQPEPPFLLLFLRNLQPFTSPDAFDPFVVHTPARIGQKAGDHPISIAAIFVCQLNDVVGQPFFISAAVRHLTLRGSMLTQSAAGAAL